MENWENQPWLGLLGMKSQEISESYRQPTYTVAEFTALLNQDAVGFFDQNRRGRGFNETYVTGTGEPTGCAISLADAVIRIAEFCAVYGINIDDAIGDKMAFRAERARQSPYRRVDKPA